MDYLGYMYASLLAVGGAVGYLKTGSLCYCSSCHPPGSVMSLIMGSLTGLGAVVGAYRASVREDQVWVGLLVSLLVAARSADWI